MRNRSAGIQALPRGRVLAVPLCGDAQQGEGSVCVVGSLCQYGGTGTPPKLSSCWFPRKPTLKIGRPIWDSGHGLDFLKGTLGLTSIHG